LRAWVPGFWLAGAVVLALAADVTTAPAAQSRNANIVLILADDLGYGDLSCYGGKALQTPHVDRLAKEGLRFTDAHSTSATCTPSRYSLLTGEYAWRRRGTGVLPGDAPLIIEPGRDTLASVLRRAGYRTGIIGKWHLGLGRGDVDWNGEVRPGPQEVGFDVSYIMAATGDRVPCVYLENSRVVGLDPKDPIRVSYKTPFPGEPPGAANPELLKLHPSHGHDQAVVNGISRIGYMTGGRGALWKDEEMGDRFLQKAIEFITANSGRPFFLYCATHEPHVPRVPHPRFAGKSGLGPRGDVILQFDWSVGQLMEHLERSRLAENTLVILTSDNGPILDDGYKDLAVELAGGHRPGGPLRGSKYSSYEAGTRVPFIVRWPSRVKPGISHALMCQVDLLATLAALTQQKYDSETARDSRNHLAALLGESPTARRQLVEQGAQLALRDQGWKYIPANKGARLISTTKTETGNAPLAQLFNLAEDLGETNNLAAAQPEKVAEMAASLDAETKDARAGRPQN
jgi:arylsulfatase A-like enzyme